MASLKGLRRAAAALYGMAWEARRRGFAAGLLSPQRVPARVVSVGNLTTGGTGKTTLTLHLVAAARAAGRNVAVVCRDYRPGPRGIGDESALYRSQLGDACVFSGLHKLTLAQAAAVAGHDLILIDDGFSHWALERDLDLVLVDAMAPWEEENLLPAGRLREPRRALQRADWLVLSRVTGLVDPARVAEVRRFAPGARFAAGRHRVRDVHGLEGEPMTNGRRVRVVTATGHPDAVAASARELGLEVTALSPYRDHHWFSPDEAARERSAAERDRSSVLITAKDAVRWPRDQATNVKVLEVEWEWIEGGAALLADVLAAGEPMEEP